MILLRPVRIFKQELEIVRATIAQICPLVKMRHMVLAMLKQIVVTPVLVLFGCSNSIFGNRNTQVTDCANVGGTGCFNAVGGDGNTQTINCGDNDLNGCFNRANGNDNTQRTDCESVGEFGCSNSLVGERNVQSSDCTISEDWHVKNLCKVMITNSL